MKLIKEITVKKSRKCHCCDGRQQLEKNLDENDDSHKSALDQYKSCRGINKGDSYKKQVQRDDGELLEFKSCLGCSEQIEKFGFYEND